MSRLRSLLLGSLLWLLAAVPALAQTSPNFTYGYVPTVATWNNLFASKQDYLGAPPLLTTGGTMVGPLGTAASIAGAAGLNVPPGTAPTSPINGDLWTTSAGIFARINGNTYTLFASAECFAAPTTCVALFGYANPVWWGADPTNSTPSTTAFNSANGASKMVTVSPGTYQFTGPILMQPNGRMTCQAGVTLTQPNGTNLAALVDFNTNTANRGQIDHCGLDGNRTGNTDNASVSLISTGAATEVTIVWNTINNSPGSSISATAANTVVENNTITNAYSAGIVLGLNIPNAYQRAKVHLNRITGPYAHCISAIQTDGNDITDNDCISNVAQGGAASSMVVNISGTTATLVSGTDFTNAVAGQFLVVNGGTEFSIAAKVSNTQLTLATSGSFIGATAAIGSGDIISLTNVAYTKVINNRTFGGATGGIVLSNEGASTENNETNDISHNHVTDAGSAAIVVEGNGAFGSTVTNNTNVIGNIITAPGRSGAAGSGEAGLQIFASSGRVDGLVVDGNQFFDPFAVGGGYCITGSGQNHATNVVFGNNLCLGFANGGNYNGYPTYASLPSTTPTGTNAFITDGLAANCADKACSTWGTAVTAGGGALKLNLFYNGSNWVLGTVASSGVFTYPFTALPSIPPAGNMTQWFDSVDLAPHWLNSAGAFWTAAAPKTCSTHQFMSVLATTGSFTCTQPAVGDISGLGTGIATWLSTPSSANLAAALTDETGTGAAVFGTAPTFTTSINITPTVVNSLPTCNSGADGLRAFVTNNNTAVSFGGAVTTGGSTHSPVYCDGSASAWKQG